MSSNGGLPGGAVCDDRAAVRRTVTGLLVGCGFQVAGEAVGFAGFTELLARVQPRVAVVGLPLAGRNGLHAVGALHAAAPGCEVVLLSAFSSGIERAAIDAGAWAVVGEQDPRALRRVLLDIARSLLERQPPLPRVPDRQGKFERLGAGQLTAHGAGQGASDGQAQT